MIALLVILPLVIGIVTGLLAGVILKKEEQGCYAGAVGFHDPGGLRREILFQQCGHAPAHTEFYADRYGIFRNILKYGIRGAIGTDHVQL